MLECLILGDSIAVGTHLQRYECTAYAKGGINSWHWNKMYGNKDLTAGTVIISLGSNDHAGVHTFKELLRLRENVQAAKVFWILPNGNLKASGVPIENVQENIKIIARNYNDVVLPIPEVSKDGIHPTGAGYRAIAQETKK
jgi:lysophospholipase L1-like esterase